MLYEYGLLREVSALEAREFAAGNHTASGTRSSPTDIKVSRKPTAAVELLLEPAFASDAVELELALVCCGDGDAKERDPPARVWSRATTAKLCYKRIARRRPRTHLPSDELLELVASATTRAWLRALFCAAEPRPPASLGVATPVR